MKKILIIILLNFYVPNSFASSPQVPDYLIYNNDTIPIYNFLVEKYLQTRKDDKDKLSDLSFRYSIDGTEETFLNCWRGYQAIYKIENDSLFISAIINCHSYIYQNEIPENYIEKIFKKKVKNGKVFVDWYSGNISFPSKRNDNKEIRWEQIFDIIFMYETAIKIDKGKVIEISEQQNYIDLKKGINRLEKNSISDILFNSIKNYKWTKLDLEKFDCGQRYTVVIGKNGKITDVVMTDYQTEELIKEYWDTKKEYNHCVKSIKKALSKLQFDILKRKGEPTEEYIYIEIWFKEDGTIENWTN